MSRVRGILVDLDGVVRLWHNVGAHRAESECSLPPGTISRIAYDGRFDLAHHGLLTHQTWVAEVHERLIAEFGSRAQSAATIWSADRGQINPPIVDLLHALHASGLVIAALTNNTSAVTGDLKQHGIHDLFHTVINSADIGVCKPAPAAYRIAAARMGLRLDQIAFLDDTLTNVQAAQAIGLRAHHYTHVAGVADFLASLGIDPHPDPDPAADTAWSGPGPLIDQLLAPLGPVAAPLPAAFEADQHTPAFLTRYLASDLTSQQLAEHLAAGTPVTATVAFPTSVGLLLAEEVVEGTSDSDQCATAIEVRLVPAGIDPRIPAGDPAGWLPAAYPASPDIEHLPAWTPATLAHASAHIQALSHQAAFHLTALTAAAARGDRTGAALALDQARLAAVTATTLLARHHPSPSTTTTDRYLGAATASDLAASWHADPTTPAGLAAATNPIVRLLRHLRYTARTILGTELSWPWDHLSHALGSLLGEEACTDPLLPAGDAMYSASLAHSYDLHRPVPEAMAQGLRAIASRWLKNLDVLEIGAGTGRATTHLANGSRSYQAIEYSPAMTQHLAARDLPNVTVITGDAHQLPLAAASVDVVIEHEALPFTTAPSRVLTEIQRVLRPGGYLLRVLLHPLGGDPATAVDAAYQAAAFARTPGPVFIGKGTDHHITRALAGAGYPTSEETITTWQLARTPQQVLAPYTHRAWPYLHTVPDHAHAAGLAAAERAARDISGPDGLLRSCHRLYVLATAIGAADAP